MSTLSKPLWRRPKAAILAKRDKFVDDLDDVYNNIMDTTGPYIDPESYEKFKIACRDLYLYRGHDGREHASCERYFTPMSANELRSYPIDEDDKDTMEYFQLEPLLWEAHKILGDEPMDAAQKMCRIVDRRFRFPRELNDKKIRPLWKHTDWLPR
jgi:hypothetical protein